MKFNEKALAKLQAPEELTLPVRYARSPKWLVLGVLAVIVLAAGVWAATGSVPRTLDGPGILTHAAGSFTLQSPVAGQITGVEVAQGDKIHTGNAVVRVRDGTRTRTVRTVAGGQVVALLGQIGQIVSTGSPLAVIERIGGPKDHLVAVLYVPGINSSAVPAGTGVGLTVQTVPAQQFGLLRGRIIAAGRFPESREQVTDFLGDGDLGARFTTDGPPVKVVVELLPAPATPSGYAWTTGTGPPFGLDSRMLVRGAIDLTPIRPINLVVP